MVEHSLGKRERRPTALAGEIGHRPGRVPAFPPPIPQIGSDPVCVGKRIAELSKRYRISEIGFDPWKATQLAGDLENEGHMMVEVRQGHRTLGEATDELVSVVTDCKFVYDDNPVLRWNAKHCIAREDENGNRIPSKKRSRGNIDGISATIIAMSRALAGGASQSMYNPGAPIVGPRSRYNETA